jgi:hypothetical protein
MQQITDELNRRGYWVEAQIDRFTCLTGPYAGAEEANHRAATGVRHMPGAYSVRVTTSPKLPAPRPGATWFMLERREDGTSAVCGPFASRKAMKITSLCATSWSRASLTTSTHFAAQERNWTRRVTGTGHTGQLDMA